MKRDVRMFGALFTGLIALHLALVLSTRLYPFTDIPDHLAAATILRHAGEPSNRLAEYYAVDAFLKPNTAHLAFCSLRIFPSVEAANRAYFAICTGLLPLSVLLVLRKLRGNPWFALLSFLFVYNYNASWGFAGFVLAIPLVLLFCRSFVFDERGVSGAGRLIGAAAFLVLLYFVHLLAAMFCLLVLFVALLFRGRRSPPGAALGAAAASLPLIILTALWWRSETRGYGGAGLLPFLSDYYRHDFVRTFAHRAWIPILDNYHLLDGAKGYVVAGLFSLSVVASAAAPFLSARKSLHLARPAAALPLLLGALLCCLVLPNEIPQQTVLYERFTPILFLALIVYGGSRAPEKLRGAFPATFAALAIIHWALWANYFFDFNRENKGFDRAFMRPAGSDMKLAGLVYDYTFRGRPVYIHFPSYYIVWEKAPATAKITDYRFAPVRRRVSALELPGYLEWVGKFDNYDGRYGDMDYLLVRGEARPGGFERVRSDGRWSLYERSALPENH